MTVTATDGDEPGNYNSEIRYNIVNPTSTVTKSKHVWNQHSYWRKFMWILQAWTKRWEIHWMDITGVKNDFMLNNITWKHFLFQQWSRYTLLIVAADMEESVLSTTGTAVITITDSNDNAPEFEKTSVMHDWFCVHAILQYFRLDVIHTYLYILLYISVQNKIIKCMF